MSIVYISALRTYDLAKAGPKQKHILSTCEHGGSVSMVDLARRCVRG